MLGTEILTLQVSLWACLGQSVDYRCTFTHGIFGQGYGSQELILPDAVLPVWNLQANFWGSPAICRADNSI